MRTDSMGIVAALGVVALGACDAGEASETGETAMIDEAAISTAAADYRSYGAIAAAPFASQHSAAAAVQIWVPDAWAEAYRAIDPTDPDASASLPEGAMIIKEHLDGDGQPEALTVMVKGPVGYAPDAGDWWWGILAVDGTITQGGTLPACVGCHSPRAGADWLFGVAPADQS